MEQSIIKKTVNTIKGRSIFLIGMMGSGNSKTGLKLAELLKYKYIDLDSLIEKLAKKSINQIFNDEGEENFRELEANCLKETIKIPSLVISTGGGVVTKSENWGILRQGIIAWIDIDKIVMTMSINSGTFPIDFFIFIKGYLFFCKSMSGCKMSLYC